MNATKEHDMAEKGVMDSLGAIGIEFGEIVIDSFMKDGLLRDIPIIGTAFSVAKLITGVSDIILLKNITVFMRELDFKSDDERDEFKKKYLNLNDFKRIGEKIILFLNAADDEKKIRWLTKALRILVDNEINEEDFLRLTMIIKNSFPDYVEELRHFKTNKEIASDKGIVKDYVLEHLHSVGFLSSKSEVIEMNKKLEDGVVEFKQNMVFYTTEFGKMMLKHIINS